MSESTGMLRSLVERALGVRLADRIDDERIPQQLARSHERDKAKAVEAAVAEERRRAAREAEESHEPEFAALAEARAACNERNRECYEAGSGRWGLQRDGSGWKLVPLGGVAEPRGAIWPDGTFVQTHYG